MELDIYYTWGQFFGNEEIFHGLQDFNIKNATFMIRAVLAF